MKPDKITLFLASIVTMTSVSWFSSCTHEADNTNLPEICFDTEVLPVFKNNCAISGCHDGNGEEMALTNYNQIREGVVPGNPNSSELFKAIITTWGENKMPPDQPLTQDNRTIIRVWIEQGAKETKCDVTTVSKEMNKISSYKY